jgi:hypothetical protein
MVLPLRGRTFGQARGSANCYTGDETNPGIILMIIDDILMAIFHLLWAILETIAYFLWRIGTWVFKGWTRQQPAFVKEIIKLQLLRSHYRGISPEIAYERQLKRFPNHMLEGVREAQARFPGLENIGYDAANRYRDGKITKEIAFQEIEKLYPGFSKRIYRNVWAQSLQDSRL